MAKKIAIILIIVIIIGTVIASSNIFQTANNYYNLEKAMKIAEYEKVEKYTYNKNYKGKDIKIKFDFENEKCTKNEYEFDIKNSIMTVGNTKYIDGDKLEEIVNYKFSHENPLKISGESIDYTKYDWTDISKLIAHAGGSVRENQYHGDYTNSYEAIVQNYTLGHRVFEYDFYLTSDDKLACVHDWKQFGDFNGRAYSEKEWLESKTVGSPVTQSKYTTMTIDTLMEEMLVNPDIFIVTDTKSTQFPDEKAKLEFELIYEASKNKSAIELMDRIIPQIYNNDMYKYVKEVYDFPNIIYTTYSTRLSGDEIMSFVEAHDDIKVVTQHKGDNRIECKRMHDAGKLVFVHTVNDLSEVLQKGSEGVDAQIFYYQKIMKYI